MPTERVIPEQRRIPRVGSLEQAIDNRLTLGLRETADLLGISETTVRNLVRKKTLPSSRIGKRVLIPRSEVLKLAGVEIVNAQVVPAGEAA